MLRPGGRLLVTTPNYQSLWPLMEWMVDRSNKAPRMAGEQHISKFNPASLRRLLAECGLNIEYFGTIYNLSPFLSLVSQSSAEKQLDRGDGTPIEARDDPDRGGRKTQILSSLIRKAYYFAWRKKTAVINKTPGMQRTLIRPWYLGF